MYAYCLVRFHQLVGRGTWLVYAVNGWHKVKCIIFVISSSCVRRTMHKMHMKHITVYLFRLSLQVRSVCPHSCHFYFHNHNLRRHALHYTSLHACNTVYLFWLSLQPRHYLSCQSTPMTLRLRCRSSNSKADSQRADGTIRNVWRN